MIIWRRKNEEKQMEKKQPVQENPDVGYLITNISYGIRQYFDKLFVDYDVTYPQSRVLTRLFGQLGAKITEVCLPVHTAASAGVSV